MRRKAPFLAAALSLALLLSAQGQSSFQNLDFESANIPLGTQPGSYLPISDALPGWMGYLGTQPYTGVLYNSLAIGSAQISMLGPGSPVGPLIPGSTYTPVIQSGIYNGLVTAAIAQTGLVPPTARSLSFTAIYNDGSAWEVTIAGQNIPMFQIGLAGGWPVYAGDISAFAGQTAELRFTALCGSGPRNLYLDAISFSSNSGPEPSVVSMFTFGALLLNWGLRRKPKL